MRQLQLFKFAVIIFLAAHWVFSSEVVKIDNTTTFWNEMNTFAGWMHVLLYFETVWIWSRHLGDFHTYTLSSLITNKGRYSSLGRFSNFAARALRRRKRETYPNFKISPWRLAVFWLTCFWTCFIMQVFDMEILLPNFYRYGSAISLEYLVCIYKVHRSHRNPSKEKLKSTVL